MGNYYCLMASLPDIELADTQPGYSLDELREQCEETLSDGDRRLLANYFYLRHDCQNLVKLLKDPGAEPSAGGNYTKEQYEDLITCAREMNYNVSRYPAFMSDFARAYLYYNKDAEGYFAEDEMAYQFLRFATTTCPNRMIRRWHELNLNITNFLTAVLARRQGWSVGDYVKGEGEVQDMLREKTSKDFDLGKEHDYVQELMRIVEEEDPVRKEKMADAMKWLWLDEETFFEPFSVEALFAYLCKLEMQYRWANLDVKTGEETFKQIIENLRGEAKVPDEFRIR